MIAGTAGCGEDAPPDLPLPSPPAGASADCGSHTLAKGATWRPPPLKQLPANKPRRDEWLVFAGKGPEGGFDADGALHLIKADGSSDRSISRTGARSPVASPDGNQIAFIVVDGYGPARPILAVSDVNGTDYRELFTAKRYISAAAWSPDGKSIAFLSDDYLRIVSRSGGPARKVTNEYHFVPDDSLNRVEWSPDGKLIAFSSAHGYESVLVVVRPDGTHRLPLAESGEFAWSPDGSMLAFGTTGLSVMRPDGSGLHHLVAPAKRRGVVGISWSPDGKVISFESEPASDPTADVLDLCVVSFDGAHLQRVASCMVFLNHAEWSSDGRSLAFVQGQGRCRNSDGYRVAVLDAGTNAPRTIADSNPIFAGPVWVSHG